MSESVGADLAHIGNYLMDMRGFYTDDAELSRHLAHLEAIVRRTEHAYWEETKTK